MQDNGPSANLGVSRPATSRTATGKKPRRTVERRVYGIMAVPPRSTRSYSRLKKIQSESQSPSATEALPPDVIMDPAVTPETPRVPTSAPDPVLPAPKRGPVAPDSQKPLPKRVPAGNKPSKKKATVVKAVAEIFRYLPREMPEDMGGLHVRYNIFDHPLSEPHLYFNLFLESHVPAHSNPLGPPRRERSPKKPTF